MKGVIYALIAVMVLVLSPTALVAAPTGDSDRPGWAGPNPDEPRPGNQNDEPGIILGEDYGDLWVVLRNGNGEPYTDSNGCLIPVAADGTTLSMDFIEGSCELPLAYADLVQEVEFGRLSVIRAPDFVLESSLAEAMSSINSAKVIALDASGRLLLTREMEIDGVLTDVTKAIDSPLENVALYLQIMVNGFLPGMDHDATFLGPLDYLQSAAGPSTTPQPAEALTTKDFDQAASFIAAAADKTGNVSVDLLVNINTWLGLNSDENGNREYFNFGMYQNNQMQKYANVAPLLLRGPVVMNGQDWFVAENRDVLTNVIFSQMPSWYEDGGATEFTKAADDSLQVIEFIHNWSIPAY